MNLLQQELTIKNMTLKNRLVMPPMATSKSPDGFVTQELCDYYDEKSSYGDIGLIILEHSYVHPQGMASFGQLSISRDEDVEGLSKLVDLIHKNGSKVMAQISYAGSATMRSITGFDSIGPSAVLHVGKSARNKMELPKEMSKEEIEQCVEAFEQSARRAKDLEQFQVGQGKKLGLSQ